MQYISLPYAVLHPLEVKEIVFRLPSNLGASAAVTLSKPGITQYDSDYTFSVVIVNTLHITAAVSISFYSRIVLGNFYFILKGHFTIML